MAQKIIWYFVLVTVLASVGASIVSATPDEQPALSNARKAGCVSGGCLIPLLLFIAACFARDTGGPLFWPLLCVFGSMAGYLVGTLWFAFRRRKTKTKK